MRQAGWHDAYIWLVFMIFGFLLPLAMGIVVRAASGGGITMEWIVGGGQFAVSSTGLLMTTSYFVARPGSLSRLPLTEWFFLASVLGLVLGIVLFILATLSQSGIEMDPRFYQVPSVGLFVLALLVTFVAVGLDRTREINDNGFLERNKRADRESLAEGFEATL